MLTDKEIRFAEYCGFELGYDDDDEDKVQYCHICFPYPTKLGALCKTDRLWGHGGSIKLQDCERVTCVDCVNILRKIIEENDNFIISLLVGIKRQSVLTSAFSDVDNAAAEFVSCCTDKSLAKFKDESFERLQKSLEESEKVWKKVCLE